MSRYKRVFQSRRVKPNEAEMEVKKQTIMHAQHHPFEQVVALVHTGVVVHWVPEVESS